MIRTSLFLPMAGLICLCIGAEGQQSSTTLSASAASSAPRTITFQDALALARRNSVEFNAAITDHLVAREDKKQARAALLPGVNFNNQAIYNEPRNGEPRFIAANGVHEYVSQGNAHESVGYSEVADFRKAQAQEAAARAKAGIAERGLVVTVVQSYYGLLAAQRKYANVQEAAAESTRFLDLSRKL